MSTTLKKVNGYVGKVLVAAYAYYWLDKIVVSDAEYDSMTKAIGKHYDKLTHRHLSFIPKDIGTCGSLYDIPERDYPLMVVIVAHKMTNTLVDWDRFQDLHYDRNYEYRDGNRFYDHGQEAGTLDQFFTD